jgi:hypothetical protein
MKNSWLIIVLALVLSACNFGQEPEPTPDVGAIFTAAAETVVAQFSIEQTQTAQAAPTITPLPTNTTVATFAIVSPGAGTPTVQGAITPLAATQPGVIATFPSATSAVLATQSGPVCLSSTFVADVNHPDGSSVKKGEWIKKTWSIQNTGTCTWDDGFALIQYSGDITQSDKWELTDKTPTRDFVEPNEIIEISLEMKIPGSAGEHGGCWRMRDDRGSFFGTPLCVLVVAE